MNWNCVEKPGSNPGSFAKVGPVYAYAEVGTADDCHSLPEQKVDVGHSIAVDARVPVGSGLGASAHAHVNVFSGRADKLARACVDKDCPDAYAYASATVVTPVTAENEAPRLEPVTFQLGAIRLAAGPGLDRLIAFRIWQLQPDELYLDQLPDEEGWPNPLLSLTRQSATPPTIPSSRLLYGLCVTVGADGKVVVVNEGSGVRDRTAVTEADFPVQEAVFPRRRSRVPAEAYTLVDSKAEEVLQLDVERTKEPCVIVFRYTLGIRCPTGKVA